MFDSLTTDNLYTQYSQLFDAHTRRYQRCTELHTQDPAYPARRAAMDELGEHMHAMYAEIKRREAEAAGWTEYACTGCGAAYSAQPFTTCPHKCAKDTADA